MYTALIILAVCLSVTLAYTLGYKNGHHNGSYITAKHIADSPALYRQICEINRRHTTH